ncbi:MAG: sulfatase-like hydrolase/transferase, partial [Myxococcota bacterium]|nr:sulfatase-like hydrolase/transferase [Myxococcota bacterium]
EWYFFHGVAYDLLWSLPLLAPLLLLPLCTNRPRLGRALYFFSAALFMAGLTLSHIDHESMRFLAFHLSMSRLKTYGSPDAIMELPGLLAQDAGGPFLPVLLLLSVPPLTLWSARRWGARWLRLGRGLRAPLLTALGLLAFSYLFLFHIWRGHFRLQKLRPPLESLYREWRRPQLAPAIQASQRAQLGAAAQRLWSEASQSEWVFPSPAHPFYRLPLHQACQQPTQSATLAARCAEDRDGDGHSAQRDCDDLDPTSYPGAEELPSDGRDQDCSGLDAAPWNVVLLLLESHRAVNVGHLIRAEKPGAPSDSPILDQLAAREDARVFTRHQVNGVPTIEGFFSAHCSIYSKGAGHAATDDTTARLRCLPDQLAALGFERHFFTAAAPDWDNQSYWLSRWYDQYHFDRGRQSDLSMFRHMGRWMREKLSDQRPFFVGAITKTNHYPFNPVDDMRPEERAETPNQIGTTMRYSERALAAFFEEIKDAPWRERTLFIITADHGFNLGEGGRHHLSASLYRESTWLPLLFLGAHPALMKLPKRNPFLSSHVDLAPTILSLVGARPANHFVGHDLLDPNYQAQSYVFAGHHAELAFERGAYRALFAPPKRARAGGSELFHHDDFLMESPLTRSALSDEAARALAESEEIGRALRTLTVDQLRGGALLPAEPL